MVIHRKLKLGPVESTCNEKKDIERTTRIPPSSPTTSNALVARGQNTRHGARVVRLYPVLRERTNDPGIAKSACRAFVSSQILES